jgi:hypothetical protein
MASQQEQNGREENAMDKANRTLCSCCAGERFFEIRVRGHLDSKWSDWLEGLEVQLLENGETVFSGTLVDQAALMGVLNKLNGLNLTLLSVSQVNRMDQH